MSERIKNYVSIEELKVTHKVTDAVFEGVKTAKRWKSGRQVQEEEFLNACDEFKTAPIDGKKEEVKG